MERCCGCIFVVVLRLVNCGKEGRRGGGAEGKEIGDEIEHAQASPPSTPSPSFAVRGANVLLRSYFSHANRRSVFGVVSSGRGSSRLPRSAAGFSSVMFSSLSQILKFARH